MKIGSEALVDNKICYGTRGNPYRGMLKYEISKRSLKSIIFNYIPNCQLPTNKDAFSAEPVWYTVCVEMMLVLDYMCIYTCIHIYIIHMYMKYESQTHIYGIYAFYPHNSMLSLD